MNKKILIFAPFGSWIVHHQLDAVLGAALKIRGAEITTLVCDGIFKNCFIKNCNNCQQTSYSLFSSFKLSVLKLGSLLEKKDFFQVSEWVDSLKISEYSNANFEGGEIGLWIHAGICNTFFTSEPDLSSKEVLKTYKSLLFNGAILQRALKSLYRQYKPDYVTCYGATLPYYHICLVLSRMINAEVLVHERGLLDDSFLLCKNENHGRPAGRKEAIELWKKTPLTLKECTEIKKYLYGREKGSNFNRSPFYTMPPSKGDVKKILRIQPNSTLISIFGNSDWELGMDKAFRYRIFNNATEGIQQVLDQLASENYYLIFRLHPNMVGSSYTDKNFLEKMFEICRNSPENVRIIMPKERLTSYQLSWNSDAGLTFGSTMGIESLFRGLCTASSVESHYSTLGMGVDLVKKVSDYKRAVSEAIEKTNQFNIENLRLAYRCAHFYFYKLSFKFKSFGIKNHYSSDIRIANIKELHPGNDQVLDQVCNHIMNGEPLFPIPDVNEPERSKSDETHFLKNELSDIKNKRNCIKKEKVLISEKSLLSVILIKHSSSKKTKQDSFLSKTIKQSRYNRIRVSELHVHSFDSLTISQKLLEKLNVSIGEFIYIGTENIHIDEAFFSSSIDFLNENGNEKYDGEISGAWICNSNGEITYELLTERTKNNNYKDLFDRWPQFKKSIYFFPLILWRKNALLNLLKIIYRNSVADDEFLMQAIIQNELNFNQSLIPMITIYPTNIFLYNDIGESMKKKSKTQLLEESISAYSEGNLLKANQNLKIAVKNNPNDLDILIWLARIYCDSEKLDNSLECIDTILRINSDNIDAIILKALIAVKTKDHSLFGTIYNSAKQSQFSDKLLNKIMPLKPTQTAFSLSPAKLIPPSIKVIFIQPAEPFGKMADIPISLIGMASILRENGIAVEIIDARLEDLSVSDTIELLEPKTFHLVGITGFVNSYRYIKDFSFEFKRKFPDIPLIAGGVFIMTQPELILPKTAIDVACTGEGEDIIVDLVHCLVNKKSLNKINNIAYFKNGQIFKTKQKVTEDFNVFPFPAYDLIDNIDIYLKGPQTSQHLKKMFFFPLTIGRGCIHHCYYCGRATHKVRRLSPERAIELMDYINRLFGVKGFLFSEDSALQPRDWMIKFCNLMIKKKKKYYFFCVGCPEQLDDNLVSLMAKAGCIQSNVAVEHWSPQIQRGFYRTKQSNKIINAIEILRKNGIYNDGFNILWGHPNDTAESFRKSCQKSIEVLREYDIANCWFATLVVYPNSKFQKDAFKKKKIRNFEDFMYANYGYGPYVNLTKEDDDMFRGVIREQNYISEMSLCLAKINYIVNNSHNNNELKIYLQKLLNFMNLLFELRQYLSMSPFERNQARYRLEKVLNANLYNPEINYFHEIGCYKEMLSIPQGSKIAVYNTKSFRKNHIRLFNSVRESKVKLISFIDNTPTEKEYEDFPLIPLHFIHQITIDYLVIPATINGLDTVIKSAINFLPNLKIIVIEKDSFQNKPWRGSTLTGGIYNQKHWEIVIDNNNLTYQLRGKLKSNKNP